MTDPVPEPDAEVYAVPYRAGHRGQEAALSTGLRMGTAVVVTLLAIVGLVGVWWLALPFGESAGLVATAVLVTVVAALVVWVAWRPVRVASRRQQLIAQAGDAMRISADGVSLPDLDRGGWIVLPWPAIVGAQVMSWRDVQFLHLELSPDLRPDEPGALGLDNPVALRELTRRTLGLVGPRFALSGLARSTGEIDEALRRYSGDRVSVT